jgi:transcription antitermination factor NusG
VQSVVSISDPRSEGPLGEGQRSRPAASDRLWLAAYTRPHFEHKVQTFLQERQLECFLPTYRSLRRWSDRRKVLNMPLFPSYVFVRLGEDERRRAVQAPGLLWFVHNQDGPVPVSDTELDALRRLMASGLEYDPLTNVEIGDEIEVVLGPMAGCRGRLLRKSPNSIAFMVSAINGAVRVHVPDPAWVAPVKPARLRDRLSRA